VHFYWAGNSAPGPEFPPLNKISGGWKFLNFRPFEIRLSPLLCVVVQHSVKGPEILVLAEFLGAEKFHNFRPCKIWISPYLRGVVQLVGRGLEILIDQNFRGPEISEFPALRFFAKSFLLKLWCNSQ
jgi:hypothetical protein